MLDSRTVRYTMFGLLYFAQGAILSYMVGGRALGVVVISATLGLLNLLALPLLPLIFRSSGKRVE